MNNTQKQNLFLLFSGRLISLIGTGIQTIAIPLYILDLTGSGTLMGFFLAVPIGSVIFGFLLDKVAPH